MTTYGIKCTLNKKNYINFRELKTEELKLYY